MGHTYQSYRSTNLWSFCQLGAEMIGSFWQTNAPFKVWADQNKTDLSCVLQVLFQIWRSVFSSEAAHFIAHFRLVCDPFDAINDNSGDAVACDRFKMFRLWDTHTSLTAQPIYDPFVSLVQKWLEASGKQMRHSRYGLIRTRRTCLVCSKSFFRSDEASFLQKLHTSLHTSDWSVILLTL